MKRSLYIGLILTALSLSSCEDFLDEQPVSELSAANFWKTEDDVIAGVAGMYDGLQDVISERYIDWGEGRSDNMTNGGTGINEINFALNSLTANMGQVNWDDLYATISRANLAIKYIPQIEGGSLSEKSKNNYLAQAHAMRAYAHFLALKVWGDVPLMLEPVTDRSFRPSREKNEVVLAKVVEDLTLAATLVDPANTSKFEITIGAIYAMLTDAYMWQKDYPKAIEASNKLMKLNRYALVSTPRQWNEIFSKPSSSSEAIWSLFWEFAQDGSNNTVRLGSSTNTSPFEIDDNLLAKWEMNKKDFRRYLTYDTLQAPTQAVTDIYKHYPVEATDDKRIGNLVLGGEQFLPPSNQATIQNSLYRYADILLMRAEALNMLGDAASKEQAITLLNSIKARAGVPPVTADMFASERELETAILEERQFEFFAEGKRWFDLRRTGRVIEVMDPLLRQRQTDRELSVTGFGDPGFILFPISRDALNENPNLEQNAPYSR